MYLPDFLEQGPLKCARDLLSNDYPDHEGAQTFALLAIAEELHKINDRAEVKTLPKVGQPYEPRPAGTPGCFADDGQFICTEPKGHAGPHIADGRLLSNSWGGLV